MAHLHRAQFKFNWISDFRVQLNLQAPTDWCVERNTCTFNLESCCRWNIHYDWPTWSPVRHFYEIKSQMELNSPKVITKGHRYTLLSKGWICKVHWLLGGIKKCARERICWKIFLRWFKGTKWVEVRGGRESMRWLEQDFSGGTGDAVKSACGDADGEDAAKGREASEEVCLARKIGFHLYVLFVECDNSRIVCWHFCDGQQTLFGVFCIHK